MKCPRCGSKCYPLNDYEYRCVSCYSRWTETEEGDKDEDG